jgi:hypothetical protein
MKISLFDSVYSMGTTNTDQKDVLFSSRMWGNLLCKNRIHCQRRKITIDKENGKTNLPIALEKRTMQGGCG